MNVDNIPYGDQIAKKLLAYIEESLPTLEAKTFVLAKATQRRVEAEAHMRVVHHSLPTLAERNASYEHEWSFDELTKAIKDQCECLEWLGGECAWQIVQAVATALALSWSLRDGSRLLRKIIGPAEDLVRCGFALPWAAWDIDGGDGIANAEDADRAIAAAARLAGCCRAALREWHAVTDKPDPGKDEVRDQASTEGAEAHEESGKDVKKPSRRRGRRSLRTTASRATAREREQGEG